jgi:hypothetical protein
MNAPQPTVRSSPLVHASSRPASQFREDGARLPFVQRGQRLANARRMSRPSLAATVVAASLAALAATAGTAHAGGGLELGFLGGQRNYQSARFARTAGDTSPSLISTFQGSPFDGVTVAGVGFEMNMTIDGVRVAFGYARPYVQWSGPIMSIDPATRLVSTAQVRSMDATEKLFALGYQVGLKKAKLSLDLVGTAGTVTTDLAIGEQQGTYESSNFGFSLRTGVRYPFHKAFYFHAAGEAGLSGSTTFGATFGIGSGIP